MANKVLLKKSSTAAKVPTTSDLDYGELALNYTDGNLYYKNSSNVVKSFGSTAFTSISSNTTAVAGRKYLCNTSGGAFTLTLPASPVAGDTVVIADAAEFATYNLTVGRNASTIEGSADDLALNLSGIEVTLTYSGTTWNVYAQLGANGGDALTLTDVQTLTNKTLTSPTLDGSTTFTGVYHSSYLTTYGSLFIDGSSTNNIVQVTSNSRTNGIGLWSTGGTPRIYSAGGIEFRTGVTLRDRDTPTGGTSFVTIGATGAVGVTYNPATATGVGLTLSGKDTEGGTGYFDILRVTNTTSGVSNGSKTLRLNNIGTLEVINSAYSAAIASLSDTGNLYATGTIISGAWAAGQVIKDTMLDNSQFTVNATTVATSTSDTDFITYSYTPVSSSSYLIIHVHVASYDALTGTGGGSDSYFSRIKVGGTEITYGRQATVTSNSFRTGNLFPLTGRYTNASTAAKTITVGVRRDSADDSITITNSSTALWMRITEVAR